MKCQWKIDEATCQPAQGEGQAKMLSNIRFGFWRLPRNYNVNIIRKIFPREGSKQDRYYCSTAGTQPPFLREEKPQFPLKRSKAKSKDHLHFAVLTRLMISLLPVLDLNFTLSPRQGQYKLGMLAIHCCNGCLSKVQLMKINVYFGS